VTLASPRPHPPAAASASVRVRPAGGPPFDIAYARRGAGEPMVLLHGIGHHWQAWEPVLSLLAASHEVLALDLPGFGASSALPDAYGYGVAEAARALAETFRALGLERPHVVGNSLGGLLALELGRTGEARSVTALAPAGFWNEAERRYAFGVLTGMRLGARLLPDGLVERLSRTAAGRAALTSTVYARPGRRAPEAVVAETRALRDALGFVRTLQAGRGPGVLFRGGLPGIPVTVAWGTKDRLLLPRQGVRAKKVLPGARLVRLPGCGHVPMNDDPDLVARVVLETVRAG
jgi:pimeloyl-ACP methyl ester carboxylesterase